MIIVVDDPDDFLEHYGVKGMQWGVTRSTKKSARKDVQKLQKLNRQSHRGVVEKRRFAKEEIARKSAEDPVYAKAAKKEQHGLSAGDKAAIAAIGAAYIYSSPTLRRGTKSLLVGSARLAGKAYRRAGESQTERFLRRHGSTFVGDFIDVNNGFPALMR